MLIPIFHFSFPGSFKVLKGIISFLALEQSAIPTVARPMETESHH